MSFPLVVFFPRTRRSKSFAPTSLFAAEPKSPLVEPTFIRSFDLVSVAALVFDEISRSFLICSCSILEEICLIRSMKDWNCCKLRRGPRLKDHRIGKASKARKSASAILPTCLKSARAAIMTAGSFVFMAFSNGTTFSCTVYLSSTALLFALEGFVDCIFPSRSSPASGSLSCEPPQRTTKAPKPRTLMPRLLVLLKTAATVGNSSFLMVEKSRIERMIGTQPSDLSTIACVGDSKPRCNIGSISMISQPSCAGPSSSRDVAHSL